MIKKALNYIDKDLILNVEMKSMKNFTLNKI